MRDEITRQNLQADIFILVLSAHKQLSDADLSLIRILHGLRKERLVIFVNRIDELSFVSADAESIFHYVRHQIEHEFPGYNIPIILGSSHWSNMSLRSSDNIDFHALNQSLIPYAKEVGVISGEGQLDLNSSAEIDRKFLAYILEFASGMPRLSSVISSQMMTSKHAENLAKVVRTLRTVSKGVLATVQKKSQENSLHTEEMVNQTGQELSEQLKKNIHKTKMLLNRIKNEINETLIVKLTDISEQLEEILDDFIEGQTYELRQVIKSTQHIDKWYVNVAFIRNKIEQCCNENFELLRNEFDILQAQALDKVQQVFSETYGVSRESLYTSPVTIGRWEMPLEALSQVVALDLKGAWWEFIKSETATTDAKCDKLRKLIREDFTVINEELLRSAHDELQKYLDVMMEQFLTTTTGVLESRQQSNLNNQSAANVKLLSNPGNTSTDNVLATSGEENSRHSNSLLESCEVIDQRLKNLEDICLKPYKLSDSIEP